MGATSPTERNVDALIAKLRADGVEAGRTEAERLTSAAREEGARLLAAARAEAAALREQAQRDAANFRKGGEEALQIAMRDAIMMMKSDLIAQLEADVRRMVSSVMADPDMLKRMILELVGAARDETGAGEETAVILPARVLKGAAAQETPHSTADDPLSRFALGLAQDMLKRGVTLYADETLDVGLRARVGDDLTIDLSDEAIASLLMRHLQPRFRAILEGVMRPA